MSNVAHLSLPPPTILVITFGGAVGAIAMCSRFPHPPVSPPPDSSPSLITIRCGFILTMAYAMYWSFANLSDVDVCNDTGEFCSKFSGWMQVSTFTRWCWILEGVYFLSANMMDFGFMPRRVVQVLFGISLSCAILVTTLTYGVLVPGALWVPQPIHRQGSITILLSPAAHAMHSLNTVFILLDLYLSRQSMNMKDMIFGIYWGLSFVIFEWIFHHYTNSWHYPPMDYNKPYAPIVYVTVPLMFFLFWFLGCKVTGLLERKQKHN